MYSIISRTSSTTSFTSTRTSNPPTPENRQVCQFKDCVLHTSWKNGADVGENVKKISCGVLERASKNKMAQYAFQQKRSTGGTSSTSPTGLLLVEWY